MPHPLPASFLPFLPLLIIFFKEKEIEERERERERGRERELEFKAELPFKWTAEGLLINLEEVSS